MAVLVSNRSMTGGGSQSSTKVHITILHIPPCAWKHLGGIVLRKAKPVPAFVIFQMQYCHHVVMYNMSTIWDNTQQGFPPFSIYSHNITAFCKRFASETEIWKETWYLSVTWESYQWGKRGCLISTVMLLHSFSCEFKEYAVIVNLYNS